MAVDPTGEDIKRFLEDDDGGPVVMLNLLRFKPGGGEERYAEYAAAIAGHLDRVGGEIVYAGSTSTTLVAPSGHRWDAIAVVRYPTRKAFLEMVMDPGYQQHTHLRTEALEEAVLEATTPWPGTS